LTSPEPAVPKEGCWAFPVWSASPFGIIEAGHARIEVPNAWGEFANLPAAVPPHEGLNNIVGGGSAG